MIRTIFFLRACFKPRWLGFTLAAFTLLNGSLRACTIFVLTDAQRTLFFNNEDWSNPAARLWFVPAGKGYLGCAYVGFDDGWGQGGVNTEGLAFDWVADAHENWKPDPGLLRVRGNPAERMLETCTNVTDAIAFFRTHREPSFARAHILVADRTGASVIIGLKNGRLDFATSTQSRGFGYGGQILKQGLASAPQPTVESGETILRACRQEGPTATKYANVFDLKSGDMFLFSASGRADPVTLNLAAELGKGGHYYDLPQLREQAGQPPRPLLTPMKRFFLDEFSPIPDPDPGLTQHIQTVIQEAQTGAMRSDDYTAEFWKAIAPAQREMQAELVKLGKLQSLTLVDRRPGDGPRSHRYLVEFGKVRVLQTFELDDRNRVAGIRSEGAERKLDEEDKPQ